MSSAVSSIDPAALGRALDRLLDRAVTDGHYEAAFGELCDGLAGAGLPLLRGHIAMHALHPLVASVDVTWMRGRSLSVNRHPYTPTPNEAWLRSPLYWMLENEQPELRRPLHRSAPESDFPLFEDLRALGGTEYLALMAAFGDPDTAFVRRDGIITSWVSDAPGGFRDEDVATLKRVLPRVALVAKLSKHEYLARSVLSTYLGEDAGRRVLSGQIRRGDVERIPAVIWLSDLRDSTAMAEAMEAEEYLHTVNRYFDCTAGAVLEHRGEVLRFIGDAVLAVFPLGPDGQPGAAARRALGAAREARRRMDALNARRGGEPPLEFGLGLHVGEVLYGNIGVPTRLEFSVIGRAANEVSRLESLTREVGEPVLVSQAFTDTLDAPWRPLGTHRVKGVRDPMEVFAPPEQIGER